MVELCQEVKPFAKFGLLRMFLESHSHVAITAVWLFLCLIAFTLQQKPFYTLYFGYQYHILLYYQVEIKL